MTTYIETLKINIDNIPLVANQLIFCTDNGEGFYDVSTTKRIGTGKIYVVNTAVERDAATPSVDDIYYVKGINTLYKYNGGWVVQANNTTVLEALFTSNNDLKKLLPVTLKHNGVKVAPRTFLNLVYTADGTNLDDILKDLDNDTTTYTTVNVKATTNNQSQFVIPYPFTPYDLYKNALAVAYNGSIIDPDTYTFISNNTILKLPIDIPLNGAIKFIFIYANSKRNLNAYSVNNIRVFLKKPPTPRLYDIVFNLFSRNIEQYDGTAWRNIGSSQYGLKLKYSTATITSAVATVSINIPYFDKNTDSIIVVKNSVVLTETVDYTISSDSTKINKISGNWEGSSTAPIRFTILCFKNVPLYDGSLNGAELLAGSITESKLSQGVIDKLNRDYLVQSDLDTALSGLIGTAPGTLNTLGELALALNNDPNYVKNQFAAIAQDIAYIYDKIANKIIITIRTIDGKSVDGQIVTLVNNKTNEKTYYNLANGINKITLNVYKATSYTASVNLKTGYITPEPITLNSGHLGDVLEVGLMYHL